MLQEFTFYIKAVKNAEECEFERKLDEVKKIEGLERAIGFIFSRCGFTAEAEEYP